MEIGEIFNLRDGEIVEVIGPTTLVIKDNTSNNQVVLSKGDIKQLYTAAFPEHIIKQPEQKANIGSCMTMYCPMCEKDTFKCVKELTAGSIARWEWECSNIECKYSHTVEINIRS